MKRLRRLLLILSACLVLASSCASRFIGVPEQEDTTGYIRLVKYGEVPIAMIDGSMPGRTASIFFLPPGAHTFLFSVYRKRKRITREINGPAGSTYLLCRLQYNPEKGTIRGYNFRTRTIADIFIYRIPGQDPLDPEQLRRACYLFTWASKGDNAAIRRAFRRGASPNIIENATGFNLLQAAEERIGSESPDMLSIIKRAMRKEKAAGLNKTDN